MAAILGGHVAAGVSGYGEFAAQIKEGKLRALAVSSPKRISIAPQVPTLKEAGLPQISMDFWVGVVARNGARSCTALRVGCFHGKRSGCVSRM